MLAFIKTRWFKLLLALGVVSFAVGIWVLLHPASLIVQPWRARQATVSSRFVFGPYPVEEDMRRLKDEGVTTIISLLNPDVPYEKVLLEQERVRASEHGIAVKNFPMGSILGQKFGDEYEKNSRAAAQTALDSTGIVYIHCYLGLHRAKNVQHYLSQRAKTRTIEGSIKTDRSADQLATERASAAIRHGDYEEALQVLDTVKKPSAKAWRNRGWALFRLDRLPEAKTAFEESIKIDDTQMETYIGLGYVALRLPDTELADRSFSKVMNADASDLDANEGLMYVRYRQGRHDEALPLLKKVLENNPDHGDALEMWKTITGKPYTPARAKSAARAD